jgi:hypothetical protein
MWTKQGWRYWEKRYKHDLKEEKEEKERDDVRNPMTSKPILYSQ